MSKNNKQDYKSAFSYLFRFINPHKKYYIGASIMSLVLVATGILHAKNVELLIDSSIDSDISNIIISAVIFVALVILNITLNYLSGKYTSKLSAFASKDLKNHNTKILITAKYKEVAKLKSGDTISTINSDTQNISDFIAGDLVGLFAQFVMAIGAFCYIVWVNPLLALITFAYTPIGMWATTSINKKMNVLYPQNADYKGEALSVVEQALMQIPIIKSYMMEKRIRKKISQSYDKVKNTEKKISFWYSLMQPACSSTANVPKIMFLIFAGYMVMRGDFTLGAFIAIFDLLNLIIGPTVYFPFMLNGLNKSIASINRIRRLEELEIDKITKHKLFDDEPMINIDNITFSYDEGNNILKDFTFNHTGSGIIAFCGGSGTGKTTLLDIIAGLYTPDIGEVTLIGDISFVTQDSFMFNKTIRQNVHIVKPSATHIEVDRAIMLSGAKEFVDEIGSDTLIGEGKADLSGGQKQRISLARAILADKPIILMDEPTSALDVETEKIVIQSIKDMAKDKLVIMSAHRKSLIDIADRVVMIGGEK